MGRREPRAQAKAAVRRQGALQSAPRGCPAAQKIAAARPKEPKPCGAEHAEASAGVRAEPEAGRPQRGAPQGSAQPRPDRELARDAEALPPHAAAKDQTGQEGRVGLPGALGRPRAPRPRG